MQLYLSTSQTMFHVPQDVDVCSVKAGLMAPRIEETQLEFSATDSPEPSLCLRSFWISTSWLHLPNLLDYKIFYGILLISYETFFLWNIGKPIRVFSIIPFHDLERSAWIYTLRIKRFHIAYSLPCTFFLFGSLGRQLFSPHMRGELIIWVCNIMLLGFGRKGSKHTSVFTCAVNCIFFFTSFFKYRTLWHPVTSL